MKLAKTIDAAAREAIRAALVAAGGNVRAAAGKLGLGYSTLQKRIGDLGLRAWLTRSYSRSDRQPRRKT